MISRLAGIGADNVTPSPWPRWLSLAMAARYASMCKNTLRQYIEAGDIYGSLKGGKWYVDRESIDAFFLSDEKRIDGIVSRVLGGLR